MQFTNGKLRYANTQDKSAFFSQKQLAKLSEMRAHSKCMVFQDSQQ